MLRVSRYARPRGGGARPPSHAVGRADRAQEQRRAPGSTARPTSPAVRRALPREDGALAAAGCVARAASRAWPRRLLVDEVGGRSRTPRARASCATRPADEDAFAEEVEPAEMGMARTLRGAGVAVLYKAARIAARGRGAGRPRRGAPRPRRHTRGACGVLVAAADAARACASRRLSGIAAAQATSSAWRTWNELLHAAVMAARSEPFRSGGRGRRRVTRRRAIDRGRRAGSARRLRAGGAHSSRAAGHRSGSALTSSRCVEAVAKLAALLSKLLRLTSPNVRLDWLDSGK